MKFLKIFALIAFTSLSSMAQYNDPVGARSAALGGISSIHTDVWSVANNQAGIGNLKKIEIGAYYENRFLVKQLSRSAFVAAVPTKKGTFGLSYSGFGYSAFKETKLGLAYGMAFGENFSAGVQLDYLNYKMSDIYGRSNAVTGELGFRGVLSKSVVVAAHLYNPFRAKITSYNNEVLPSTIRLGLQYIFSEKVNLNAEAEKTSYQKLNFKGGIEYKPSKELYIRAGANSFPKQVSFGVGVLFSEFKCDVSAAYHSILGFSPQIGLSYSFGESKKETAK